MLLLLLPYGRSSRGLPIAICFHFLTEMCQHSTYCGLSCRTGGSWVDASNVEFYPKLYLVNLFFDINLVEFGINYVHFAGVCHQKLNPKCFNQPKIFLYFFFIFQFIYCHLMLFFRKKDKKKIIFFKNNIFSKNMP